MSIVNDINSLGYRINNLYQMEGKGWRCNLTDNSQGYEFFEAPTLDQALLLALRWAQSPGPKVGQPHIQNPASKPKVAFTLEDLGL